MSAKQSVNDFFMEQERTETEDDSHGFSISVAISNLKGSEDVQWTTNYERKCKAIADQYDRKICKLESQWSAINILISKMIGLRAHCRTTTNPTTCMNTLQNSMLAERMKQRKIRSQIGDVRRQKTEAMRNQKQAQRQQGVG